MSIFPQGYAEVVTHVSRFETIYSTQVNGHRLDVLEVDYKETDYSLRVDGIDIFVGWRDEKARRMVARIVEKLSG